MTAPHRRDTQFTPPQHDYLVDCAKGRRHGPRTLRERQSAFSLFKRGLLESDMCTLTRRGREVYSGMRST